MMVHQRERDLVKDGQGLQQSPLSEADGGTVLESMREKEILKCVIAQAEPFISGIKNTSLAVISLIDIQFVQ